jgi:hypothetical protein
MGFPFCPPPPPPRTALDHWTFGLEHERQRLVTMISV